NDVVEDYGYPFKIYNVETEDGYILQLHNIPFGRNVLKGSPKNNKPVVLVMHGNLGSSADWVVTGPSNGLAFLLADSGYDVWLGNNRGNTYSKNHTIFLETSYGFWDFSWHEMGIYDLPAMIDFVLQITGQKQLFYIGYSQGGTQFFVMNSMKPEYNDKIRLGVTFAPAVFLGNTKG
ncbi:lipase 3-like, partial [Belonocnema kinseyi]|uniref:lipase 3-like n=1 Tax=Belonocnema kinseyi TaxID=2817044 RepID=UPI00143DBB85